eukprot:443704-Rhodomonas_salina.1
MGAEGKVGCHQRKKGPAQRNPVPSIEESDLLRLGARIRGPPRSTTWHVRNVGRVGTSMRVVLPRMKLVRI